MKGRPKELKETNAQGLYMEFLANLSSIFTYTLPRVTTQLLFIT